MSYNQEIADIIVEYQTKMSKTSKSFELQLPHHNQIDVKDTAKNLISIGQIHAKIETFYDGLVTITFDL